MSVLNTWMCLERGIERSMCTLTSPPFNFTVYSQPGWKSSQTNEMHIINSEVNYIIFHIKGIIQIICKWKQLYFWNITIRKGSCPRHKAKGSTVNFQVKLSIWWFPWTFSSIDSPLTHNINFQSLLTSSHHVFHSGSLCQTSSSTVDKQLLIQSTSSH